tara:strand:+ start:252 stop:527 length:276 start_codon:yes stop_codon:yes gene_type:complete
MEVHHNDINTKKEMIDAQLGLPMVDIETAEEQYVYCSTDLILKSLVESDGEIVHGMNVLVLVNQPSQNITDSYKLMMSIDYFDWVQEEEKT